MKNSALMKRPTAASLSMQAASPSTQRPTVLVVDDTPTNLHLLSGLLNPHYRVLVAPSGAKALEIAATGAPDLILLDVMMPLIDGYEVCRRLKGNSATQHVPVIFLTALTQPEDESAGFEVGGADFIHKPFNSVTVLARVRTHLQLKAWQDSLRESNADLSRALVVREREVERLRDTSLFVMVGLAEFRDADTGNHIQRTQEYVRVLATWYAGRSSTPRLNAMLIDELAKAAPLHDIGKVAIPDSILLKPGPLAADEWTVMKTHTEHGGDLLQRAVDRLGEDAGPLLRFGIEIARHHHEKWDGSGYPDGLAGEEIPLAARLMAVADVYDALISRRPYKEPMSHEVALMLIREGSGKHFDPELVEGLMACKREFMDIACRWRD
jgi:putative two-component system response regulator